MKLTYPFFKDVLDRGVAAILLVLAGPILILSAIAIVIDSRGPIFFRQQRVGIGRNFFTILKFRTMSVDNQRSVGQTYSDSPGVTRTGRFLRRSKIDELPQLISVLTGDMSVVGPRPCMPDLLPEIDDESLRRFSVKPGITGLAQVNGNVNLSWPERWRFDLEYVDNRSLALDLKILIKTISVVVLGEKKSAAGKQS